MTLRSVLVASSILIVAACATPSKPEPVKAPTPERQAPAPVPAAPQVMPPVRTDNLPRLPLPVYSAPTPGSLDDFVYASGGDVRVYFGYNQFDLSQGALNNLRRQANWLALYPQVTAVIEGNADERGTREYNLALAARRADAVKSFLVGLGIAPNRLTTVSYGKERPIDPRSNEDGWAQNRNSNTNLMSGTIG